MKGFERSAQVKGKQSMGVPGLKSELQYVCVSCSSYPTLCDPMDYSAPGQLHYSFTKVTRKGLPAEGDFLQGAAHIKGPGGMEQGT